MSSQRIKRIRDEMINKAKEMHPDLTYRELADMFSISKTTIVRVLNDDQ